VRPARSRRLDGFGTTIFTEMTRLAQLHGAINLSQGFPDFDGPDLAKDAAIAAIREGHGQYARMSGAPELHAALGEVPPRSGPDYAPTRVHRPRLPRRSSPRSGRLRPRR
jgi:N-succinyldiaminopimelate aminotransferase